MTSSLYGTNWQSSPTFTGLAAGTYTVYVKDAASCVATTTAVVGQPTQLVINAAVVPASCNATSDGEIDITATGRTPGYLYSIDGVNYYPSGEFTDLDPGVYTISIKDDKECVTATTVTITQPTPILATITTGNSTCGNANGNILAVASGGSGNGYQYSIDGSTWNSTGSFTGLADSAYNVIIEDGSGCS